MQWASQVAGKGGTDPAPLAAGVGSQRAPARVESGGAAKAGPCVFGGELFLGGQMCKA